MDFGMTRYFFGKKAEELLEVDIPFLGGSAYYSFLLYPELFTYSSRLEILSEKSQFSYSVIGDFTVPDAIDLASKLPRAKAVLDGLCCTVTSQPISLGNWASELGREVIHRHLFCVAHPGVTNFALGTIFEIWGFGIQACVDSNLDQIKFPEVTGSVHLERG